MGVQRGDVWRNFLETLPPPSSSSSSSSGAVGVVSSSPLENGLEDVNDDAGNKEMVPSPSPSPRFDYKRLSERYELNGRQIRSTYHVARTLARQKKTDLTQEMLEDVIEYS